MWQFDRIPEGRRLEIAALFTTGDVAAIDAIYSEFDVYPAGICRACKKTKIILEWTRYAITEIWNIPSAGK